jgi:glycosyltransferase involved in cell wall biosynthesis
LRLLIIHNKYRSSNIGGEDVVYSNELKSLQDKLGIENVYYLEVSNDNINKFKLIFGIWFSFKFYIQVKKLISNKKIDIVHVHNFYPILTPSIFLASKKSGSRVILTLHNYRLWCISGTFYRDGYGICEICSRKKFPLMGIFYKCYRNSLIQSGLAQISFWFYRFFKFFDNIDYFFVLTNFQKNKVLSLGIDKSKVVLKPNFIKHNVGGLNVKKGYIFIGRLEESKGVLSLLEVWKKLDEKFVLTIVGDGKLRYQLMNKYKQSNILFKGKCTREETINFISKSKFLIQPSLWYETFGLTIIEAMSLGVPVIGFNIGTRPDFIEDGVNGFLTRDNENLLEVIKDSYSHVNYFSLSNNAILKSKEFETDYLITKQIDIYRQILDKRV